MNTTDIFADNWKSHNDLVDRLKDETGVLETPRIERAFREIDRRDFVRDMYDVEAYEDYPIPIGQEQTISQPTTVVYMLELLSPQEGDTILDVGCGSGWTTALLGEIVGRHGRVVGMEIIEELAEFGQKNLARYELPQAEIRHGNPLKEKQPEAPFSRILVSAGTNHVPKALTDQLAVGGVMVIPIDESLVQVKKKSDDELLQKEVPGFVFVPLQE
ncbi:MAG: protein-L-isoaspartate O-methyltransferase [Candidatus Paceibacterota bacterium]